VISSVAYEELRNVLVPTAGLPLHVFEPRYRTLVEHCLAGDREFWANVEAGAVQTAADYSQLGVLLMASMVIGLVLPFAAIMFARVSKFKSV
jgi:hypothetical protein